MPSIEGLRQNYPVESLKILMINTGESEGLVEAFIRRSNYSFSVLLDSEGGVAQRFSVYGIPAALLIDKEGRAVFRSLGYRNWNTKKIHAALDSVIEE